MIIYFGSVGGRRSNPGSRERPLFLWQFRKVSMREKTQRRRNGTQHSLFFVFLLDALFLERVKRVKQGRVTFRRRRRR
ncbi:hypothetical protein GmHk_02G005816 [Glycine max]|nr:hypothetical protein GmHk_02G005816 [Glycine max]